MKIYMNDLMKSRYETAYEIPLKIKNFIKREIKRAIAKSQRINDDIGERIVLYEVCKRTDIFPKFANMTCYEYACNELWWPASELLYQQEHCIHILLDALTFELKRKYPNRAFGVYVSVQEGEEGYIQAWFHLYRTDDPPMLSSQLENYKKPVLFMIIET